MASYPVDYCTKRKLLLLQFSSLLKMSDLLALWCIISSINKQIKPCFVEATLMVNLLPDALRKRFAISWNRHTINWRYLPNYDKCPFLCSVKIHLPRCGLLDNSPERKCKSSIRPDALLLFYYLPSNASIWLCLILVEESWVLMMRKRDWFQFILWRNY